MWCYAFLVHDRHKEEYDDETHHPSTGGTVCVCVCVCVCDAQIFQIMLKLRG